MVEYGGVNMMKNFLGVDKTPPVPERPFEAATKLIRELTADLQMERIPLEELSSLVENIHIKTRETSQNNDFDMREF